jgi:hypothetical protein
MRLAKHWDKLNLEFNLAQALGLIARSGLGVALD